MTKKALKTWCANVWQRRWPRWLIIIFGAVAGLLGSIYMLNTFAFQPVKNPNYGVSFSKQRAEEFGVDWRANYLALLDDLQLKHYRLMSYWSAHEPTRGQLDFADLDWQMNEAAKRGATVSLAIGLRQPRWPECHQPEWALTLKGNEWKQALYAYIKIVAERYQHHPALASWQLENEGMNNWFGECEPPDRERLIEEFALLKKLDPDHPIIMSLSDQHGLPLGQPVPDQYGFSVYRRVYSTNTIIPFYLTYPTPIWYHRLRAALIDLIQHRPIMIHEMQLEPWGPGDTKNLSIEEQNKSMSIKQITKNVRFARQIGLRDIDLWGAEWWYWRKVIENDNSVWEAVRSELNRP